MTNRNDGIFTEPGPNGIFGRGGPPGDPSSPPIDSDGAPLRDTLIIAYPSPGHMRVARAVRHAKTGEIKEYQEQFREPTVEEQAFLKEQGLNVGAGSMVLSGLGNDAPASTTPPSAPPAQEGTGVVAAVKRQPWVRIGMGVAVGVAGYWAYGKYIAPMFGGKKPAKKKRATEVEEDFDVEDDEE